MAAGRRRGPSGGQVTPTLTACCNLPGPDLTAVLEPADAALLAALVIDPAPEERLRVAAAKEQPISISSAGSPGDVYLLAGSAADLAAPSLATRIL